MARILHYLDTDQFAGTEQHVLTLMRALIEEGESCALACLEGTELAKRAAQIPTAEVFTAPRNPYKTAALFAACAREWKPDVIHAHNGRTSLQAARLAGPGGKRTACVATQHFVDPAHANYSGAKRAVANALHAWTNARLRRIIAVSEAARVSAIARERLAPEKVVTVHNGIEPPCADADAALAEMGLEPGAQVVTTIARLNEEKGHRYLLEAAPEILKEFPKTRFFWVGTGPLEKSLRADVEKAGLSGAIRVLGYRRDALNFVAAANLMALPSLCEPFGLALVEAMMLGAATLATDAGGPQEILQPALPASERDAVGWLVKPASASALSDGIRGALRDPKETERIGHRGQARARAQFTARRMATRTIEVYRAALGN